MPILCAMVVEIDHRVGYVIVHNNLSTKVDTIRTKDVSDMFILSSNLADMLRPSSVYSQNMHVI